MATNTALQSQITQLQDKLRIATEGLKNLNPNLQMNQAIIARYKNEVATIPGQIAALQSQINNNTAKQQASTQTATAATAPRAGSVTATEKQNLVTNTATDSAASTAVARPTAPANITKEPAAEAPSKNNFGSLVNPYATASSIVPNRLHQYSTYTYGLTLHLLTQDSFNAMADGQDWIGLDSTYTLVSSAGRWGDKVSEKLNFQRPPEFADDFYFDGFSMETIIGLNQQGRGTNVIDVNFTLIEPYGLTFMNRLLALALRLKVPNYLANPYVLQIDFFGSNDSGTEVNPIPNITKFVPIKLIECKIKVGTQGATYACRATPYNHSAFAQTIASTPVNFEVTARQVGDFFNNTGDVSNVLAQAKDRSDAIKQRENLSKATEATKAEIDNRTKSLTDKINAPFKVKSYTGAYNAYQQFLKTNKTIQQESVLIFKIDPTMAKSDIVYPKQSDVKTTAMTERKEIKGGLPSSHVPKNTPASAPPQTGPKTDVNTFNVNAGTSLVEVVNMVMRNSTYITSQIKDTNQTVDQALAEGKALEWFKIVPKIKLRNYDFVTNTWSHEITINVVPFTHHNYKHPSAETSSLEAVKKGLRKEYNYMYTGKNDDVIEFNIDFDALFYTAVNVLKDNLASLSGADKPVEGDPKPDAVTSEVDAMLLRQTGLQFNVIRPVAGEAAAQGFNAWQNTSVLVAADIMKSVYSGARGDMINLQVKIVGDPDFIKQDDLYLSPSNPNYPADGELFAPDGSILTDRGDIFCRMTFRTPVDMDPATGGLRHDNAYLESNFSGVYKIIKVTNELRGGKFEQVLNMIRWPDDPLKPAKTDSIQQRANKDTAKADREANNAAILAKVNQAVNSGATTESAKTTDSLAVASRRRNAEAREKSQSKPATATLPARIAGRPFGRGVPQSAKTNWDKQYSANYNPDGTLKAGTGPGVDPRLKKVANTGDTKSIADAPEFLP